MAPWSARWGQLARASGIRPEERLLVALSGGADSVLLLHLAAAARPRPEVIAVHVHHGLRGAEADQDARACENLARALGVPFRIRRIELDPSAPSLEARARESRYRALVEEAIAADHPVILTGHHSDDALETLLMRWVRGTAMPGLPGLRRRVRLDPQRLGIDAPQDPASVIEVVRPLHTLRREEVRRVLRDRGIRWRDDSSNADQRFTRNRIRHRLLPLLEETCGPDAIENLRGFGRAIERLEDRLAGATAHLSLSPPRFAHATRGPHTIDLGGSIRRADLMALATPLRRRALRRLLLEGIGHSITRTLMDCLLVDLAKARCTRHTLPGNWTLLFRADELILLPPESERTTRSKRASLNGPEGLPFPGGPAEGPAPFLLTVPGIVTLLDGRRISAETVRASPEKPPPHSPLEIELDHARIQGDLCVRFPRPGDRFRGIGAPGGRPLSRFLADCGIPREERSSVPVVVSGEEILWVVGLRPAHGPRIVPSTRQRLRLSLHGVTGDPSPRHGTGPR